MELDRQHWQNAVHRSRLRRSSNAFLTHLTQDDQIIARCCGRPRLVAREAVLTEAQKHGSAPRDLASTLLVAVVGPSGGGALQIGDGVIVVSDGGNGWCWVFGHNVASTPTPHTS